MTHFTLENAPSQKGKVAIVTGANDGIGFETALGLVSKGAKLVMACRNQQKAEIALSQMKKAFPESDISIIPLDLQSLISVRSFADKFKQTHQKLDILVNNAGIMIPPFSKTEEGFESQMGVNYFSHFLLTGLLMNELNAADNARVVSLSSIAHKSAKIDFDNLNAEQKYAKSDAYGQSKLACLMFAYELGRKLEKNGSQVISVASHPGVSPTNLLDNLPTIVVKFLLPLLRPLLNSPTSAALPSLMAAMDTEAKGGDYYGPTGFAEMSGKPAKVKSKPHAYDETIAQELWEVSEHLVDFKFDL